MSVCLSGWLAGWLDTQLTTPRKMAHSSPNFDWMLPRSARIQLVLEVKVKDHDIWELLC